MAKFECRECGAILGLNHPIDDSCHKCPGTIRLVEYYKMHNEFMEDVIVCRDCINIVNDDVVDDREFFHSPVKFLYPTNNTVCVHCGK